ncbi:extracellular solute-binding protein [Cohnella fermenti]|uniref:Extracellular solute-binding protein n=1 Tax=Cohnella fermenti TaxID=2565925 RepID=A0A4S4BYL9_9BACL|nr:extracellular solute-binding protein [Cohnella fermenti]THF80338.1 extracellular solute-binding protein [Cohnella fermenti]
MSYRKNALTLSAGALALVTVLSACGNNNDDTSSPATSPSSSPSASAASSSASAAPAGLDTSKHVTLQFYMLGDAPKDLDLIQDEINKMAEEELNATVKFNFTTWTDWDQKYKLLLSSGQQVDLLFTADWTQYQAYANSGAFLPLDDLLPTAAPKLQEFVPEDMWEAVKVKGKIYTVPATYKEYVTNGFVYREDLREKYNLPVPKDLATMEAYLEGIKQNEPGMTPLAIDNVTDNLINPLRELTDHSVGAKLPYGIGIKYESPNDVYSYWGSEEQLSDLNLVRSWAEKGLFAKNVLNQKELSGDLITSGKAAAMLGDNPTRYNDNNMKMQSLHPDWKLGYTPYAEILGYATPVHPIHNGFAIPKNSANPERALAFYEKLVTDKRYNLLTQYGIEGKHYTVENGYYTMIGDSSSNGFPREGMQGWAWRNPEYMLFDQGYDGVKAIFDELDKVAKPDLFTGFTEDYTSYQPERAALEQVEKQYFYPLYAGLLSDVQAGIDTAMAKAKQAGLEKIQESYKQQWLAYTAEAGIQ